MNNQFAEQLINNWGSIPPNLRIAIQRVARQRQELYLPTHTMDRALRCYNPFGLLSMQTAQVDGSALTASTTATSILHVTCKPTIQANTLKIGQQYLLMAAGRVSTVTTPGTLTLDVRFGAVIVANGGAMTMNATAKTNVPWYLNWLLTCRAIGGTTSANMMHQGFWMSEAVVGASAPTVSGAGTHMLPNAAPGVGTGFDSTANQTVDLFATWQTNNANSIQTHQFGFYEIN